MFSVGEIARIVEGKLLRGKDETPNRVIHDSRLVRPGDLFVALPGQRTNGQLFLADAFTHGACAALVPEREAIPDSARNVIVVEEALPALHQLAVAWRETLSATRVAITGTNGKTTVKAILGHMLAAHASTYVSPCNYNTEIGLPIALLSMPADARFGVFELGAEAKGDIARLARILKPNWGIITSIGPGHLDGLGTIDVVASEKWSLIEHLSEDGGAVICADCPQLRERSASSPVPILTAGLAHGEVRGRVARSVPDIELGIDGVDVVLRCPLVGSHNATDLVLAAAAAHALGVDWPSISIQAASFEPIPQRLCPIQTSFGTILDDTYNANPASTAAALRVLETYGGKDTVRAFVFGDMLGLGPDTERYHRDILQLALSLSIDRVVPIGTAATTACRAVSDPRIASMPREKIVPCLLGHLGPASVVLIKGSRALKLETLVDQLRGEKPTI
jgi:UDP-N-acetylmuramoyl-tripeptide--D-alanyl-D-alanine ligase